MRSRYLALATFISLFLFSPVTLAGTVPVGGSCNGVSDCASGLACVSGTCQNVGTGGSPGVTLINPLKGDGTLTSFLNSILDFVIRIGTVVVILMMVFVGFKFVTAQGNESKVSEAKMMLLWTVVGSLILLGAKAISLAIQATVASLGG